MTDIIGDQGPKTKLLTPILFYCYNHFNVDVSSLNSPEEDVAQLELT